MWQIEPEISAPERNRHEAECEQIEGLERLEQLWKPSQVWNHVRGQHLGKATPSRSPLTIVSRSNRPEIGKQIRKLLEKGNLQRCLQGLHILVVEDNRNYQLLSKVLLEQFGAQVTLAGHGVEALEALEKYPINLITMDIEMPVMDGIEATRHIRKLDAPLAKLPILAVTSHSLPEEFEQYRSAGINDVVTKPFETFDLLGKIMKLTGGEIPNPMNSSDQSSLDLSDLWDKARGHSGFVTQMLEIFLEDFPLYLSQLETALMAGQWEDVRRVAHRMKSPASVVREQEVLDKLKFFEYFDPEKESADDAVAQFAFLKTHSKKIIADAEMELQQIKQKDP